jgi:glyoxylase-like metal-dependent hydrolase (beta-lactamase superfamily II)
MTGSRTDAAAAGPTTIAPGVRRIVAPNAGPFTSGGTNTYIVGTGRVAVIDPGPDVAAHVAAILAALAGETVTHILLTHTHRDHSGALAALADATGAMVLSGGSHRLARPLAPGEGNPFEEAGDAGHIPDRALVDGEQVAGDGWMIQALATPGHATNHFAFALPAAGLIFSGDHVMAWATSIVAPPDGAMGDYMASLDRLEARPETRLLPGHGDPVEDARARIATLRRHRKGREAAILARLAAGDRTVPELVTAIYRDTDPRLHAAAGLSVLAHLEDLVSRGLVTQAGPPGVGGRFAPA